MCPTPTASRLPCTRLNASSRPHAMRLDRMRLETNDSPVADYALRRASAPQWRSPNEAFILQSLLRRIASPAAAERLRTLAVEIRNGEQISALVRDLPHHLGKLLQASRSAPGDLSWMGYGDEPWLLTLVSPTSFAAPVIMAVSPRRIVPAGVTLRIAPTPGTVPLGDGFVDLHVEWPAGRFTVPPAVPGSAVRLDAECRAGSCPARRLSAASRRASRSGNSGDALPFRRQRLS